MSFTGSVHLTKTTSLLNLNITLGEWGGGRQQGIETEKESLLLVFVGAVDKKGFNS